jgi:hypothetical protein
MRTQHQADLDDPEDAYTGQREDISDWPPPSRRPTATPVLGLEEPKTTHAADPSR